MFKTPLPLDELKATIGSAMTGESNNNGKPSFYTIDEKGKTKIKSNCYRDVYERKVRYTRV